jgi:hypothetical protein
MRSESQLSQLASCRRVKLDRDSAECGLEAPASASMGGPGGCDAAGWAQLWWCWAWLWLQNMLQSLKQQRLRQRANRAIKLWNLCMQCQLSLFEIYNSWNPGVEIAYHWAAHLLAQFAQPYLEVCEKDFQLSFYTLVTVTESANQARLGRPKLHRHLLFSETWFLFWTVWLAPGPESTSGSKDSTSIFYAWNGNGGCGIQKEESTKLEEFQSIYCNSTKEWETVMLAICLGYICNFEFQQFLGNCCHTIL